MRSHRHWVLLVHAMWLPVLLLVLVLVLDGWDRTAGRLSGDVKLIATLVIVALAGLWTIVTWLRWAAASLTITDQRVILDGGVFSRTSKIISLDRVQDVSTRQSVLGRILGYGQVEIDAAGSAGAEILDHLPAPTRVRDQVFLQSEQLRHREAGPPT